VTHGGRVYLRIHAKRWILALAATLRRYPTTIVKLALKYYFFDFIQHHHHLETAPTSLSFFRLQL
jgi:hypothetical protein